MALLVGLGFSAGLLIGVVTEEPELLAGHLRGESDSVTLAGAVSAAGTQAPSEGGATPDATGVRGEAAEAVAARAESAVGTAPESDSRPAAVQARRVALLDSRPKESAQRLPVVAAARESVPQPPAEKGEPLGASGSSARWAIQVGAFSDESAAMGLAEQLREKGYPVDLIPATDRAKRWRVRVQPVDRESRARSLADRLKREERLPTWVIPMEAHSGP